MNRAIAIIGGSGLYDLPGFTVVSEHSIDTPFGQTSDTIIELSFEDTQLFFLSRHGVGHRLLPSAIPYRANTWALKHLGAEWCISISAAGSLQQEIAPGDLVLPDQLIDKTYRRNPTFFDSGIAAYPGFASPFCSTLREILQTTLSQHTKRTVHNAGTYICMEGPALSTRAESNLHRSWGAHLIGMTACPEAKLAREAEIGYATIAMVTDYDCWKNDGDDVDVPKVLKVLAELTTSVKAALPQVIRELQGKTPSDMARDALKTALITDLSQAQEEDLERLRPLLLRYLPN